VRTVLDALWLRLLASLESKLPSAVLDSWIRPSRLLAVEGDLLKIGAPNKFSKPRPRSASAASPALRS